MPVRSPDRLDSWKQIARYLNRSVRTVRRWERQEGLPVHRHMHQSLGSIFAIRSEIDAWQERVATVASTNANWPLAAESRRVRSIAVLPFVNLGDDADNAYFAEGLTDELIGSLSKLHGLRVTSRTSSAAVRGLAKGVRAIARRLGVRYLLEGSVRRTNTRMRVSAQLIDAAQDVSLWGETFDGTLDDVFTMQERFTGMVVSALELRLTAQDTQRLAQPEIPSVPAYDCYLRARHEGWRWRRESIDHSIALLEQALQLIGDNVRLYAALGLAHLQFREAGLDLTERRLSEADRCVARVFALDPDAAAGLQLRGWLHYSRGRIQAAIVDLKRSVTQEPYNADTLLLLSNCLLISGRVNDARPLIARLSKVDPLTPITQCMPGFADIMEGKFAGAVGPYERMLKMDPANPMARLFYVWVLLLNRRVNEAESAFAQFPAELNGSVPARLARFLVRAAANKGQEAQAVLRPQLGGVAGASDVFPRLLAQGFAWAGMRAPALKWLRTAVDRGFINYPFLARHDPSFKAFRTDPKFRELLDVVRVRWERFVA